MDNSYHGTQPDQRPQDAQQRDFKHEEMVATGVAVQYPTLTIDQIPFYEKRDQDGSGSCMAQSYIKSKGIIIAKKAGGYVPLSASPIYQKRASKPAAGMGLIETFQIGKTSVTFESVQPSQKMNDAQMDAVIELTYQQNIENIFISGNEAYVTLAQPNNLDTIAGILASGTPMLLMHYGTHDEYTTPVPKILIPNLAINDAYFDHGVTGITPIQYNGEDAIVIDDSWWQVAATGANAFEQQLIARGQRILTRSWILQRVFGAGYITTLDFSWKTGNATPAPSTKPIHTFNRDLFYGMVADPDVQALQDVLKYEGCMPSTIQSTGNFYGLTTQAVEAYQTKHGIVSSGSPTTTGFGRVGSQTRTVLNSAYSQ